MNTASEITEPLTVAEATSLAQYEQQIADGMAGFLATGAAMLAIREGRLYRSTHRSFADYLEARWPQIGTRRQADRLINAAIVEENVRPIGLTLTSESQARELAPLEPDAQRAAFQQAKETAGGKSPTAAQIRAVVREVSAPPVDTSDYLAAVAEALRKDDTNAAYVAARAIINNLEERKRAFDAVDARVDGKSIATVLAMLDAPKETIPALSAFPPGHVEAGIGAIERRLKDGTPHLAEDVSWADQLRTQLDDARAGMQPEIYGKWSARLDAARNALKKSTTTSTATSRTVLLQHAEALLANLIDKSTAEEQRLLHALFNVGSSVHNDFVADELWRCGKKRIGMEIDLEWILTGVRHHKE